MTVPSTGGEAGALSVCVQAVRSAFQEHTIASARQAWHCLVPSAQDIR